MRVSDWLQETTNVLTASGVTTARLDSLVLLEDCLSKNRAHLLAHPGLQLSGAQQNKLKQQILRRAKHEPLAYIRGHTEFYGREFIITKAVLEPRPESETMIELLKSLPVRGSETHIADIGTGSGALGITATLETHAIVDLLEIDAAARSIAKRNVIKFATNNRVIDSDLLSKVLQPYDILLCNLPYVPDSFHINPAAMNEPRIAIFGGADGLDLYRRLFAQMVSSVWQPTYILAESLPPQHTKLAQIAKAAGFSLTETNDFIQVFTRA